MPPANTTPRKPEQRKLAHALKVDELGLLHADAPAGSPGSVALTTRTLTPTSRPMPDVPHQARTVEAEVGQRQDARPDEAEVGDGRAARDPTESAAVMKPGTEQRPRAPANAAYAAAPAFASRTIRIVVAITSRCEPTRSRPSPAP